MDDNKPTRGRYVFGTNMAPALFGEPELEPQIVEGPFRYFTKDGEEVFPNADGIVEHTFEAGDDFPRRLYLQAPG